MNKHSDDVVPPPMTPTLDEPLTDNTTKRGKDIKCFEDLPARVQGNIERLSIDEDLKQRTIERAIRYHQTHPDRYYSTGAT